MVERKTTRTSKSTSEARAFVVVLEEIRAQNKAFGEGLQGLRERMDVRFDAVDRRFEGVEGRLDAVEGRLDSMDGRLDSMDGRLDSMDGRLDSMDGRLGGIELRLGRVEEDVGLVKIAVLEHSRELKEVHTALEKKVDRDEVEAIVERIATRGR